MLETEIKKLTAAIEALAKAMATAPVTEAPVEAPVEVTVEVAAPVETPVEAPVEAPVANEGMDKDTLTRMCLVLSRAGHKDIIKAKLLTYGFKRATEMLGDKNYGAFCDWVTEQVGEIQ
tara:strand:+ start:58 stop:414 length:357 start_codon:yes stop_codon:yes gene_type:complete